MALESVNKIKSVAERDVDLLLLEEINVNPEFSAWFLSKSCPESHNSECVGAWHSVSDPELGESDLIILYKNGLAILVENKIDAPAQPRQGSRYQERGKKGIEEGNWKSFRTCMIAPKSYLLRSSGSQNYDSSISYEEIDIGYDDKKREEMLKKSNGRRTIPQIFIEEYHVGGYVELRALENKGELDNLLK